MRKSFAVVILGALFASYASADYYSNSGTFQVICEKGPLAEDRVNDRLAALNDEGKSIIEVTAPASVVVTNGGSDQVEKCVTIRYLQPQPKRK